MAPVNTGGNNMSLVGETITTIYKANSMAKAVKKRWVIVAVYPHNVLCERTTENGRKIRESFSIADLLRRGIIKKGPDGWTKA
jgi:uncharacterized protein Veg